ncbi:hypothetical protein FSP39_018704 [Pinctada imbricata]|uniref:Helix-turn-helix domain-containing protein n=1 Tax=Pinctada imbricata TaxID=66713 RepID=A0AA88YVN7_PINIB|nr:hypothetical protein FSP39_018704 [Pinctada imbricata]
MGEWEKELFSKSEKLPSSYYRYMDDIWGIWTHGEDTLKEFVKTANNIHPNIQLELRYSTENIEFLDVKITTEKGYLKTDLYTKDTDGHLYLHKSSNHPRKTKDAIPYGLGLRLRRICSSETDYKKRRNELKQQLARRGYKNHELEGQLTKTDKLDRRNLLKYKSKKKNNRVPLVITYSDGLPNIHSIVKQRLTTLHKSERMREIFPIPPIIAFRRDKNIQDILVHKNHNNMFYKSSNGSEPCGKKCAICNNVMLTTSFFGTDGEEYKIKGNLNCKTQNLIYSLRCKKCDKTVYVGQTGRTLYERMMVTISNVRNKKCDLITEHFNKNGHTLRDFQIVGIEKTFGGEISRLTKESFWIKKLKTLLPEGLNRQIDLV